MSTRAKVIVGVVVLGLAGAGIWWWRRQGQVETFTRKVATAERGSLRITVSAAGIVRPSREVEIKSKASGKVIHFPWGEGDRVPGDAILVKLDPTDEERSVRRAEADLLSAKAGQERARVLHEKEQADQAAAQARVEATLLSAEVAVETARSRLARGEALARDKGLSAEDLDVLRSEVRTADARFAQARAEADGVATGVHSVRLREVDLQLAEADVAKATLTLEEARDRLAETSISNPIPNGIVLSRSVSEDSIVSGGFSTVTGGTPLAIIADLSTVWVEVEVDEADVGRVSPGQPADVRVESYPDLVFDGEVVRIAPLGEEQSNVTTFRVVVAVVGGDRSLLLPGMTADVTILVQPVDDAVLVPLDAMRNVDGAMGVYLDGGEAKPAFRAVERGPSDGEKVAVTGIEAGTRVIVGDMDGGKAAAERTRQMRRRW